MNAVFTDGTSGKFSSIHVNVLGEGKLNCNLNLCVSFNSTFYYCLEERKEMTVIKNGIIKKGMKKVQELNKGISEGIEGMSECF